MKVRINPQTHEIEASGPNISPGYFEDEEKTRAAFQNLWYRTGDVGEFHDSFLYITGREAFRIVLPNGQKVYPEDLERKLNSHPEVKEACVVGLKRQDGEVIHASIITKYPQKLRTIISDVNKNLASHEQIMEWSRWQDEDFPRTPILKIDRRKVVQVILSGTEPESVQSKDLLQRQDKLITLISQVIKFPSQKIKENSTLATDLKLDSLGRVELLSLIEQEFAVSIPESKVSSQTKVRQLRKLIKESPPIIEEIAINEFIYSPFMSKIRTFLQNFIAYPLHALASPLEIKGQENLKNLPLPSIFYFNHIGIMDGLCVMRALPSRIRKNLVIAVLADLWKDYRKVWIEVFGAAFPFDKEKRVKASLELTGEFLDRGFSILMAPEGKFTKTGKLLEFKPGIGLLAVEMQVPVVPFKIDPGYLEIFPPMGGSFLENFPKKRKKIILSIGKPITFPKGTSYEEAAKKMQSALESL